jgi:hypothetical protein
MKIYSIIAIALIFSACAGSSNDDEAVIIEEETTEVVAEPQMAMFGMEITEEGAVSANEVISQLNGADSVKTKLVGPILKVCQAKGCWMTMQVSDDQNMHVSFKDYGYFVPKDIDGKESIIEGYAYMETMSVDDLKHYAEDAGKTQEEIDAITEPETKLSFVADGVIVKDYAVAIAE